jgi:hypothetical protein
MANPVTYNSDGLITGSLKSSVISVGINPSLNTSGYNWRNGFENNNIWVIYSDTYSQGQSSQGNAVPTIWATPIFTDAGLLNMINVLPARAGQTPFTSLSDAITWLYGENKYFLSNQNYPPISTEGLVFIVDAGFAASYPSVGTSTYDLGLQQFIGTNQNGLVWANNNTKSYFDFDGADDQIYINNYNNFNNITWSSGITVQVLYKIDDLNDFNGQFRAMMGTDDGPRSFNYYLYGPNNPATTLLYHFSANYNSGLSNAVTVQPGKYYLGTFSCGTSLGTYYHNLNVVNTQAGSTPAFYTNKVQYLGRADNFWKGNIGSWKIYNKALTLDEITQNYYQGSIVTTNLSYLWDASNLISYYSGSSTTYDMKESGINGTLQNGVGYSGNYSGYWSFDGSDDRILLTNSPNSITLGNGDSNWTVNAWVRTTSTTNGLSQNSVLSNTQGGPIYSSLDVNGGYQAYWAYPSNVGNWKQFVGNIFIADNQWHMLTWVNNSNYTMDFYVDGVYDTTVSPTNVANNNPLDVIGGGLGVSFNGNIGMVQVNKGIAFNQSQVSQQYGTTRNRYQSYEAYANGGTVTTLSQNGVNYRVHTFTSSGTLSVTKGGDVEVLMVAGGGGGGSAANSFWETGGGGGAGGLIHSTGFPVTDGTNYTVTIGAGGAGGLNQTATSPSNRSGDGSNTTFSTLTAVGGGGGGGAYYSANSGGSGGGADSYLYQPGANGTQFQGYNGGSGNGESASLLGAAGGGGGAGGIGQNGQSGSPYKGGDGGIGRSFTFSGNTPTYYAGGGGGKTAINGSGPGGSGGTGGGGNGGAAGGVALGDSGTTNTGGGGGGGLSSSTPTGSGGSGVVMIRYVIT